MKRLALAALCALMTGGCNLHAVAVADLSIMAGTAILAGIPGGEPPPKETTDNGNEP